MFKFFPIFKRVILYIIPYIILYAIYVQINGETSPGGGFQAGVIFASSIIAYDLIKGKKVIYQLVSEKFLIICAVIGVLIYAGCGLVPLLSNEKFLNHSALIPSFKNNFLKSKIVDQNKIDENISATDSKVLNQHVGIFIVELGVGLTVSVIMCLIYLSLNKEK